MDTGKPTPKIAKNKVQETLHFGYLNPSVNSRPKIVLKLWGSQSSAAHLFLSHTIHGTICIFADMNG